MMRYGKIIFLILSLILLVPTPAVTEHSIYELVYNYFENIRSTPTFANSMKYDGGEVEMNFLDKVCSNSELDKVCDYDQKCNKYNGIYSKTKFSLYLYWIYSKIPTGKEIYIVSSTIEKNGDLEYTKITAKINEVVVVFMHDHLKTSPYGLLHIVSINGKEISELLDEDIKNKSFFSSYFIKKYCEYCMCYAP